MTKARNENQDKFQKENAAYLARRQVFAQEMNVTNLWTLMDSFGLFVGVQTLGKSLAMYDLLQRTKHIPGHVAEFGCYNGGNLLLIAKILSLIQPNAYKYVFGFDSFEGLKTFSAADGFSDQGKSLDGSYQGNEERVRQFISFFGMDEWVRLVKGDVNQTAAQFEKDNPHLLFSFAYIDLDLYTPTKSALALIHKRLAPGGMIGFDEALIDSWKGEGQALVEFWNEHSAEYTMEIPGFARQPTAVLIRK